jgi:hypothetical protein
MMIINDDSRVINKLEASLTDDARVIIYNCHMLIAQATGPRQSWSIKLHLFYFNVALLKTKNQISIYVQTYFMVFKNY